MATPKPQEIAGRSSDPRFYSQLSWLPNPDPILRKAGLTQDAYSAIEYDPHVAGELQLIRADLLRFKRRLVPPEKETRKTKAAYALCEQFFSRAPAPLTTWPDVYWQIGKAPFWGQSHLELAWERSGDFLMPAKVLDRPTRRFVYNGDGELRLLTRESPLEGIPAEELYFVTLRHLPSYDQPYGVALFSSCYWPYVFKHNGNRWLVRLCERFCMPIPVGKYPPGTPPDQIAKFEAALQELIEAGYIAFQDDGSVELMESKVSGSGNKPVQQILIDAMNAEMSKALTSQTLSTEQTGSTGSRAAAETHRGRGLNVNDARRDAIAWTLDQICALITRVNFGEDVQPPRNEFASDDKGGFDRAQTYEVFINSGGNPSRKAMADDLGIELADPNDPEDQMRAPAAAPAASPQGDQPGAQFAAAGSGSADRPDQQTDQLEAEGADVLDPWFSKIRSALEQAKSLAEFRDALIQLHPDLSTVEFAKVMGDAFTAAALAGRYDVMFEASGG